MDPTVARCRLTPLAAVPSTPGRVALDAIGVSPPSRWARRSVGAGTLAVPMLRDPARPGRGGDELAAGLGTRRQVELEVGIDEVRVRSLTRRRLRLEPAAVRWRAAGAEIVSVVAGRTWAAGTRCDTITIALRSGSTIEFAVAAVHRRDAGDCVAALTALVAGVRAGEGTASRSR